MYIYTYTCSQTYFCDRPAPPRPCRATVCPLKPVEHSLFRFLLASASSKM